MLSNATGGSVGEGTTSGRRGAPAEGLHSFCYGSMGHAGAVRYERRYSRVTDQARRRLVWLAPVATAAVVAGVAVGLAAAPSSASPVLPRLTAQQLLVKVQASSVRSLSGTVRVTAALGLPSLPDAQAGSASLSWQSFLLGSHDARIWVRGAAQQRVAVLGQLSEADIVHNGRNLWTYTSSTNTVTHTVLPRHPKSAAPETEAYSPVAVAKHLLAAVRPSTSVSVARTQVVAGRAAYTLDVRPRDGRSTVRAVAIAVDAHTFLPLQVQVFGSGTSPAFQVGFSSISYATPAGSRFAFTPPAGAKVSRTSVLSTLGPASGWHQSAAASGSGRGHDHARVRVLGSGWTMIAELPTAGRALDSFGGASLRDVTTPVGTDGARLLHTALVNALVAPDGRVFVGAVRPAMLEHAAATTPR